MRELFYDVAVPVFVFLTIIISISFIACLGLIMDHKNTVRMAELGYVQQQSSVCSDVVATKTWVKK